ncbi:glycosyl transferase [Vulcanisaeta moutnovskia 768-28]|uniref:Glycosyl transferase n=1 Tax=Vulcanisaeta moutnovskia (strain 768-28) TaxID=985053 RepID=F0QY49_VULM7|nr:glycosyltransferase family 2 protein [Vulcanisaeta moutnovskia]ADY01286.1 glycosyl transferase [Vulcanisaeta moutnovskia 768-28]
MGSVSVVLLAYNSVSKLGTKFIGRIVDSVLTQTYPWLDLIVVDNGSSDSTYEVFRSVCIAYDNCHVLRLPKNYGYTGGNNRGAISVMSQRPKYLFFMNDDVILLGGNVIEILVKALETNESLGAVQPLVINKDSTVNCGFKVGLSSIPKVSSSGEKIFYVSGAALMTRAELFRGVGMFDENLFLYVDDVDYSWRLRLLGYGVKCIKEAKVYHIGSATFGAESPRFYYFITRNHLWTIFKNSSLEWLFPRLTLFSLEIFVSYILGNFPNRRLDAVKAIIRGFIDGTVGLKTLASRRIEVQRMRRVNEININEAMDYYIDVDLLFPRRVRRRLGYSW